MGVPPAEVTLGELQLRRLLEAQAPRYAHLPLKLASSGWDNFMYRLGDEYVVRLPRRRAAVPLVEHELQWLPSLAATLPLKVPAPLHRGLPGEGYPWAWSICPWIEGLSAEVSPPDLSEWVSLVRFLKALHRPAPQDAPKNPYRGVPLRERQAHFEQVALRLESSGRLRPSHRELFARGVAAPSDAPLSWIHGDLHPGNVLTRDGKLAGIIDWGDVAEGDPATDLAGLFLLFGHDELLERARRAYQASSATWDRARAWAVFFAAIFAEAGARGDARMGPIGLRCLDAMR